MLKERNKKIAPKCVAHTEDLKDKAIHCGSYINIRQKKKQEIV